jgi:hypothetical protein
MILKLLKPFDQSTRKSIRAASGESSKLMRIVLGAKWKNLISKTICFPGAALKESSIPVKIENFKHFVMGISMLVWVGKSKTIKLESKLIKMSST